MMAWAALVPQQHRAGAADDFDALDLLQHRHLILLLEPVRKDAVLRMSIDEQQDVIVAVGEESARANELPGRLTGREEAGHTGQHVVDRSKPGALDVRRRDHGDRRRRPGQLLLETRRGDHRDLQQLLERQIDDRLLDARLRLGLRVRGPRDHRNADDGEQHNATGDPMNSWQRPTLDNPARAWTRPDRAFREGIRHPAC
jgi:hypothetical protein